MNETSSVRQEASLAHELIVELTNTATNILNAHGIEFTDAADGSRMREITTPRKGGCSLSETVTPEGAHVFRYARPTMVIQLGEQALTTTVWQEGASSIHLTYEADSIGKRSGYTQDATQISYYTQLYLSDNFPVPKAEEQEGPPTLRGKIGAFIGRLSLSRK